MDRGGDAANVEQTAGPGPHSRQDRVEENGHHVGKKAAEFIDTFKPIWGDTKLGLQYGIALTKPQRQFRIGERVPLVVFFRNASDKPLKLDTSLDLFWNTPKVLNAKGEAIELEKLALFGSIARYVENLEPGEAIGPFYLNFGLGENPRPGQQNWHPYFKTPVAGQYKLTHSVSINVAGPKDGEPSKRDQITSGTIEFEIVNSPIVEEVRLPLPKAPRPQTRPGTEQPSEKPAESGVQTIPPLLEFRFAAQSADSKFEPRAPVDFEKREYPGNTVIGRMVAKDRGFIWVNVADPKDGITALPVERLHGGKVREVLLADTPDHALAWNGKWSVEECRVVADPNGGGRFSIELKLNESGGAAMRTLTKSHLNQPLAILVNGEIIAAPIVRSEIGRDLVITGNFTREQADKLATKIVILPANQDGEQPKDAPQDNAKEDPQIENHAKPEEVFARRVSLDAKELPLREALAAVARAARVPLRLDESALAETKLDLNALVTATITDEPLSDALLRLMDWNEYQGVYRELRGGALFVTTVQAAQERTERVLPDWLKPVYNQGLLVTLVDDNQIASVTAGEAMTDELLARLKTLPKLRELSIGGTTKITAAGLTHLAELTALEKLTLSSINNTGEGLGDAALQHIVGLKSLRELHLNECGTTDAGIRMLEGMPQLTHLDVYQEGRLTDAAIASIARLKRLKHLRLSSYVGTERWGFMRFSAESLRQLSVLQELETLALPGQTVPADFFLEFPRLTALDLQGPFVTDATAERIAQRRTLRSLSLSGSQITDDGWKRIATLPELRRLTLHRERITDDGIAHLKALPKLDHLELRTGSLTDEALGHLAEIKSLSRLDLWGGGSTFGGGGSDFTVAGLQQLKQLPNLRTLWLYNLEDPVGYGGLKELTQLRELMFEMATISQQQFNDLETALPKTRISAGNGWGHLRSIRNPNGF